MTPTLVQFTLRFIIAGTLAAALCSCSPETKKAGHLRKADGYFTAGEYEKAEIEYKNVLQLGGLDPHSVARLGIIYFEQGRLARSTGFLFKGNELQPDNLDVRLKLGHFYLATGKPNEARDAAIFILERDQQHADAALLLAESVMQAKDVAEARSRLQKLPNAASAPVLTALGVIDLRERKFREAEALLEQARQADPKYIAVHSALGRLYVGQKDLVRAEKAFATAAELSPLRSPVRLHNVQFNLQTGKMAEGRRILEEMIRQTPDFLPSYLMLANIAGTEKKYDESIALLEKMLGREPEHPEALLMMSQIRLAQGEKGKALVVLEKAVASFPGSAPIHYQLGSAHLASGDLGNAAASFAQAIKLAPEFPAAILSLAQVYIRQGNFAPAVDSLKAFLQRNPGSAEARLLLADGYQNQGNLEEALTIYRQLGVSSPRNPQVHLLTGSLLLKQDKKNEARQAFTKAVELSPGSLPPVEQLVNLDIAEKQYGPARARLEAYIANSPKDATPYLLLARLYLLQADNAKAEEALQKAIQLEPDSHAAYLMLAQLYLSTNQLQKALPNLQAAAAKNPRDFGPVMLIAVLHEQQKNYPAARESYEKVLAINPKAAGALNNLAYIYSEQFGELDKAQEMAQKARELLPNQGETADTLGWILHKKRLYARALPLLDEGAEKLPDNAEVRFHLGMAHYMMGDEESARPALERALQLNNAFAGAEEARQSLAILAIDGTKGGEAGRTMVDQAIARRKDDPVALSRLAAIHEREGSVEKAFSAYETALKANPSNANAALNVIRLYRARNQTAKALELAKATRKLAPGDGRIAHALGRLAYESGDRLWSVGVLQEAARRRDGDPDVLFDLAEASYSVGQVSIAETAFREALAVVPAFSRADKAREYLEMIRVAQNPSQAAAALSSIELALKSDGSNVPALMAKAALDAEKGDVKGAKQGYEKVLARFPDFTPAKRQLTLLYSSNPEDDKKAFELATKAREAFPNDAEVAKSFGIILHRQGNHTRAVSLLQESARTRTTDAEVMYYLGMSQRQLKDTPASTRSLQRALELGLPEKLTVEARRALTPAK